MYRQTSPDAMYAEAGLTAVDIAATALEAAGLRMKPAKGLA